MLVFAIVFTRAVRVDTELPYPLYAYSGLVAWTLLASSIRAASTSLTGNHAMVTKLRFPRSILPLSTVILALTDFLVASTLLGGMMVFYGVRPSVAILLLPLIILAELVLVVGLALLVALGNLMYRDVGLVSGLVVTLWMFLTSVVYPVELIGGRLGALLQLNPMNPVVDAFRAALFGSAFPAVGSLVWALSIATIVLLGGVTLFQHFESRLAEVI
jgi:ABC-type polysaccharide/polyol phosphate export permease